MGSMIQFISMTFWLIMIIGGSSFFIHQVFRWTCREKEATGLLKRVQEKTIWVLVAFIGFLIYVLSGLLGIMLSSRPMTAQLSSGTYAFYS